MIKVISGVGVTVVVATSILAFWGTHGWVTKTAYALDEQEKVTIHANQASQASIDALTTMIGTVIVNQKEDKKEVLETLEYNQDEWKCDEADEAVIDIQLLIDDETNRRRKLMLIDDLKTVEKTRVEIKCTRFE